MLCAGGETTSGLPLTVVVAVVVVIVVVAVVVVVIIVIVFMRRRYGRLVKIGLFKLHYIYISSA